MRMRPRRTMVLKMHDAGRAAEWVRLMTVEE